MADRARTVPCDRAAARARLRSARAYLDVAEIALAGDEAHPEYADVAAGNAVLAGIAAADAICCVRLGCRHRGDDHHSAGALLRRAVPDGTTLVNQLVRLLDAKDTAHYDPRLIREQAARDSVRRAARLVERAGEELER